MSDKIIYKPNDLAFFEVILVDVLTKKPYNKPKIEIYIPKEDPKPEMRAKDDDGSPPPIEDIEVDVPQYKLINLGPNGRVKGDNSGNSDPNTPQIIKAKIEILDSSDYNIYKKDD